MRFLFTGVSPKLKYVYHNFMLFHLDNLYQRKGLHEIFVDKVYNITTPNENPVIVDVGAGVGDSTLFYLQRYPNSKVYAYEPYPKHFKLLKENIKKQC